MSSTNTYKNGQTKTERLINLLIFFHLSRAIFYIKLSLAFNLCAVLLGCCRRCVFKCTPKYQLKHIMRQRKIIRDMKICKHVPCIFGDDERMAFLLFKPFFAKDESAKKWQCEQEFIVCVYYFFLGNLEGEFIKQREQ